MEGSENQYDYYSYYQDIVVFSVVLAVQLSVFGIRRFKIDTSAIITLLSYLVVIFFRFLRALLSGKARQSTFQTAVSIFLNIIVSMAIYHFVFEMRAVKIQFENKKDY
jgi:hypothetical protein